MALEKEQTNLKLRTDIKKRAQDAVSAGEFVGIKDLSGLVEFSLDKILKGAGA